MTYSMLSENISTPIYVECDNIHLSKVYVQENWYFKFVSVLKIQLEQSENYSQVAKYNESYTGFSHESMA